MIEQQACLAGIQRLRSPPGAVQVGNAEVLQALAGNGFERSFPTFLDTEPVYHAPGISQAQ